MSKHVLFKADKVNAHKLQAEINSYVAWVNINPPQADSYLTYAAVHKSGNPQHNLEKYIWENIWGIKFKTNHKYFAEKVHE